MVFQWFGVCFCFWGYQRNFITSCIGNITRLNIVHSKVANNAKYDTIRFVKYGDKPSVAVTSRIVRAVCHPPHFLVL